MDKITDIPPFYHQIIVLKWIFFCIESVFKRTFGEIFGKKPPLFGGNSDQQGRIIITERLVYTIP